MKNYVYVVGLYDYEDKTCIKAFGKYDDAVKYITSTFSIDTKNSYKMNKTLTSYPCECQIKYERNNYLGCFIQKVELG